MLNKEKLINMTLADMLERTLIYAKRSVDRKNSPRERAIAKALSLELAKAYNYQLMSLAQFGSSKLAIEKKPYFHEAISNPARSSVTTMSEEEFSELIKITFGVTREERQDYEQEINKALAQMEASHPSSTKHDDVVRAITMLVKRGAWGGVLENLTLDKLENPITPRTNLPRGNPELGAAVSKYTRMGKPIDEARKLAYSELAIDKPESVEMSEDILRAIAQVESETNSHEIIQAEQNAKAAELLDLLGE